MVSKHHPLAAVNDSFNAVFARGNFVGDVMFYGRGAGELPTASAIVGDIIDLAMHQSKGGTSPRMNFGSQKKAVVPMGEVKTQFYLRLDVKDRPGVLASPRFSATAASASARSRRKRPPANRSSWSSSPTRSPKPISNGL